MDSHNSATSSRLAALCSSLSRLTTEHIIEDWDEDPPADTVEECRLTLVAKILTDPSINLLALQTTLRRAWRIDTAEIKQTESCFYITKLKTHEDMNKILEGGHWLFNGHLVNFKQWIPNTPLHCYDFSTCDFWIQVIGLPLEWYSERMLRKAVQHLGEIKEVKMDSKDGYTSKTGRVRVQLNVNEPLITGKLIRIQGKPFWLDFRYERLSHFCFSCGKLGHYAMYCQDVPYTDDKHEGREKMAYGPWLRAEVRLHSPYWKLFYDLPDSPESTEEIIPETPPTKGATTQLLPSPSMIMDENSNREVTDYRVESAVHSVSLQLPVGIQSTALVVADQKQKAVLPSPMDNNISRKQLNIRLKPPLGSAKKGRRYSPYESKSAIITEPSDLNLLDAPVFLAQEAGDRALVAGPKQPPVHK